MKSITKQTLYSKDFKEEVYDRIFDRVQTTITVFHKLKKSELKEIIREALNDYMIK